MAGQPSDFQPRADDDTAQRSRTDGSYSTWLIREEAGQTHVTRWDRGPGATSWSAPSTTAYGSTQNALGHETDLVTLRASEATTYRSRNPDVLLTHLHADDPEADPWDIDWPFDVDDYVADNDDDFSASEGLTERLARINDQRVRFASCGDDEYAAFLTESADVVGPTLAEFGWGSEIGMTSGAGGWRLTRSSAGIAVAVALGDTAEFDGVHAFRFTPDTNGVARMLHDWARYIEDSCTGVMGAAALALEPLDPSGMLASPQRTEWEEILDSLNGEFGETLHMGFTITPEVLVPLRALLATDRTYRSIAEALSDPVTGDWLRAALAEGDHSALI